MGRSDREQINAGEIATQQNAKVNTIMKRFSDIKKRYNLNLQTTAAGYYPPKQEAVGRVVKKSKGRPSKTLASKKAALKDLLEDDKIPSGRKSVVKAQSPDSLIDASAWVHGYSSDE